VQFDGPRSTDGHGMILPPRTVADVSAGPNVLNEICVSDRRLLIVQTGAGTATHLVSTESALERAKSAVPGHWLDRTSNLRLPSVANYPADELVALCWSKRTLCGIAWQAMAIADDQIPAAANQRSLLVPTCRRCRTTIDKAFPEPTTDARVELVASLIATAVETYGSAEVLGVPGDQMKQLRVATRRELKRRLGFAGTTSIAMDRLIVTCDQATELARQVMNRQAVTTIRLDGKDRVPMPDPDWRIHWTAWSVT
jgi:hypothetical protein